MIRTYKKNGKRLVAETFDSGMDIREILWFDLLNPDETEKRAVERILDIEAPTPEEMQEIEISSRLYTEKDALHITVTLVTNAENGTPEASAVTFILKDKALVTLRYSEPRAFAIYLNRASRGSTDKFDDGYHVFLGLMEAIIDRLSDNLEMVGWELDDTSRAVFQNTGKNNSHDLQETIKKIGRMGDLNGKIRESLLGLSRVFSYLSLSRGDGRKYKELVDTFAKDISSLTDHAGYINNKVNLLLDATLGLINIEQNAIIKIFSVAAVVFLPPTLIASNYGMNFRHMPELDWLFGYPFALVLMLISAILPFLYFKKKKWL